MAKGDTRYYIYLFALVLKLLFFSTFFFFFQAYTLTFFFFFQAYTFDPLASLNQSEIPLVLGGR